MTGLEGVEYALTLWRPWAAVVVDGPKDIENRRWAPPPWIMGKRIAIHAGKHMDDVGERWIEDKVRELGVSCAPRLAILAAVGAIVGTARVVGVHAPVAPLDFQHRTSPWHMRDQYGWILADRCAVDRPVPCRGAQKLWRVPEELRRGTP